MKKLFKYFGIHWQSIVIVGAFISLATIIMFFQISVMTHGKLSKLETTTIYSSASLNRIIENPMHAPLKLPLYAIHSLNLNSTFAFRAVGAVYGLLTLALMYGILRRFFTRRVANIGILLFMTSSWLLQIARVVNFSILYAFGLALLCWVSLWVYRTKHLKPAVLLTFITLALISYIPGFLPLIFVLFVWQRSTIFLIIKQTPIWVWLTGVMLFALLFLPLAWSLGTSNLGLSSFFGLSSDLGLVSIIKRLLVVPAYLIARGPFEPSLNVARLPLLDIATMTLLCLGIYFYHHELKQYKVGLLVILSLFGITMATLGGSFWMPLLLIPVYVVTAAGIALLLRQWFTVFPKNPIARNAGIAMVVVLVGFTSFYHIKRYFVVWPNSPITESVFVERL